jgi:hypothetical protein
MKAFTTLTVLFVILGTLANTVQGETVEVDAELIDDVSYSLLPASNQFRVEKVILESSF